MRINNFAPSTGQKFNNNSKTTQSKSFSESLSETYKSSSREFLDKSFNKIKDMGDILISTQSYTDIIKYKKMIKNFLSEVLEHNYSLNKKDSFWESQYFATVEIIDKKLETITKEVLSNQTNNISIASSIDEIQGLLIDVYR